MKMALKSRLFPLAQRQLIGLVLFLSCTTLTTFVLTAEEPPKTQPAPPALDPFGGPLDTFGAPLNPPEEVFSKDSVFVERRNTPENIPAQRLPRWKFKIWSEQNPEHFLVTDKHAYAFQENYLYRLDLKSGGCRQADIFQMWGKIDRIVGDETRGFAVTYLENLILDEAWTEDRRLRAARIDYFATLDKGIKLTLTGHTAVPGIVQISSDGKRLVSTSCDNTIRLWSLETGRELASFHNHGCRDSGPGERTSNEVCGFSPDGKLLILIEDKGLNGDDFVLVDAATGKRIRTWNTRPTVTVPVFSSDSKRLFSGQEDSCQILEISVADGSVKKHSDGTNNRYKAGFGQITYHARRKQYMTTHSWTDPEKESSGHMIITIWDENLKPLIVGHPAWPITYGFRSNVDYFFAMSEGYPAGIQCFTWTEEEVKPLWVPNAYPDDDHREYLGLSGDGKYILAQSSIKDVQYFELWDAPENPTK